VGLRQARMLVEQLRPLAPVHDAIHRFSGYRK
jgi:hypothetical protein